jgi:cold shock CspA family protein
VSGTRQPLMPSAERLTGTVVRWGGVYGFIETPKPGLSWYFVHKVDLTESGDLGLGQRVRFVPTATARGPRAPYIEVLDPAPTARPSGQRGRPRCQAQSPAGNRAHACGRVWAALPGLR